MKSRAWSFSLAHARASPLPKRALLRRRHAAFAQHKAANAAHVFRSLAAVV